MAGWRRIENRGQFGASPQHGGGELSARPRGTQADSAPPRALLAKDTGEGGSGDPDPQPLLCSVPPAKQLSQPELPTGGVGHGNSTESPEQEGETGTQPKGAWPDPPHSRTSQDLQRGRTPIIWGPAAVEAPLCLLCTRPLHSSEPQSDPRAGGSFTPMSVAPWGTNVHTGAVPLQVNSASYCQTSLDLRAEQ